MRGATTRRRRQSPPLPACRPPRNGFAGACWPGTGGTDATCRGARRAIRTASSCPKSCCSRRRWTACCRSTTSGSIAIRRFEALAAAPEADVVKTWYPLGYNIRPRRLQAIAREAVAKYGGTLPGDEETLRSFKGIGAYTAGAVMSFAFGKRAAILDTNVARVLFRVFVGAGRRQTHAERRSTSGTCPGPCCRIEHVFDFNQALMDFGATVCTARKPQCLICPMTIEVPFVPVQPRA